MQRIPGRKVAAKRWRSGESEARTARYDKSAVRPTDGSPELPTGNRLDATRKVSVVIVGAVRHEQTVDVVSDELQQCCLNHRQATAHLRFGRSSIKTNASSGILLPSNLVAGLEITVDRLNQTVLVTLGEPSVGNLRLVPPTNLTGTFGGCHPPT